MRTKGQDRDSGRMITDAFTKIKGLLDAAYTGGVVHFYAEIPAVEWLACEKSLARGAAIRKWQPNHFIWRGEVVALGGKWMVHSV